MDPKLALALKRQLKSPNGTSQGVGGLNFHNLLPIAIRLHWVDREGGLDCLLSHAGGEPLEVAPGAFAYDTNTPQHDSRIAYLGHYYLVTTAFSGALVGVIEIKESIAPYEVQTTLLTKPNGIGAFPTPNDHVLIPTDSPRVLVACGKASNGSVVTREQYWRRSEESYTLAPKQTHTIGFSTTSGMQSTSSEQQTVAASLNLSGSAGWGPISASLSAGLSSTSTTFQQVTVTHEETRYETIVLTNNNDETQTFFKWQLMDVITVFAGQHPAASLVLAQSPALIGGPY